MSLLGEGNLDTNTHRDSDTEGDGHVEMEADSCAAVSQEMSGDHVKMEWQRRVLL